MKEAGERMEAFVVAAAFGRSALLIVRALTFEMDTFAQDLTGSVSKA